MCLQESSFSLSKKRVISKGWILTRENLGVLDWSWRPVWTHIYFNIYRQVDTETWMYLYTWVSTFPSSAHWEGLKVTPQRQWAQSTQILVSKCHSSTKRNQNSLEKWLHLRLHQGKYEMSTKYLWGQKVSKFSTRKTDGRISKRQKINLKRLQFPKLG